MKIPRDREGKMRKKRVMGWTCWSEASAIQQNQEQNARSCLW